MSQTDQVQDLFDRALSSVPAGAAPSPQALHQRLHRRRLRTRLSTMGGGVIAIAVSTIVLFAGLPSDTAYAVTLYPSTNGSVVTTQLIADQRVMTARLNAVGFPSAIVKVVHGALVVTNGPKDLASPTSFLTSSPELLIRSVTCYAGDQSGPVSTNPLPTTCSGPQYSASTATPSDASATGFTTPTTDPDPALSAYATTTAAQDATSPNVSALLPVLNSGTGAIQRYLVGPTLLTLSSRVASATVVHAPMSGGWMINVRLNAKESQLWDEVAARYFHRQLAIDLNGVIVEAPLIQPSNSSFSSFDGQMNLLAATKSGAYDLAAALTSGPLAVPLAAHSSRSTTSTVKATPVSSPVCQASNVTLIIGPTYKGGAGYPAGTVLTPVSFTNDGPMCHLPRGGPTVRAVRGTYRGNATKVSQLSFPAVPATNKRVTLRSGARGQSLVEVRGLPSTMLHAKNCSPHTAVGLVVEGYAKPLAASHYFARSLTNVCFYEGPGNVTNFGVVWEGANS